MMMMIDDDDDYRPRRKVMNTIIKDETALNYVRLSDNALVSICEATSNPIGCWYWDW